MGKVLSCKCTVVLSRITEGVARVNCLARFKVRRSGRGGPFGLTYSLVRPFHPFVSREIFRLNTRRLSSGIGIRLVEFVQDSIPRLNAAVARLVDIFIESTLQCLSNRRYLPRLKFIQYNARLYR